MKMGDKDDTGTIETAELHVVLLKYKKYRSDNPGLVALIAVCPPAGFKGFGSALGG